jgi:histidine triad (HIT) family protein
VSGCIFCRISRGEIPSRKVYEDDEILAFHDLNPQRPVHFLIIPKRHISTLYYVSADDQELLGRMLTRAAEMARSQGLDDGFRTIVNTGRVGGQEVYHLHIHIMGGADSVGPMVSALK